MNVFKWWKNVFFIIITVIHFLNCNVAFMQLFKNKRLIMCYLDFRHNIANPFLLYHYQRVQFLTKPKKKKSGPLSVSKQHAMFVTEVFLK